MNRQGLQAQATMEYEMSDEIEGIYFDGKKDATMQFEKDDQGKLRQRFYEEEHYSLGIEPNSEYLTHTTPESGSAQDIADSIWEFLEGTNLGKT